MNMKDYLQIFSVPLALGALFISIFWITLFADDIVTINNDHTFPTIAPSGEIQSGVTQQNFTDFFKSCWDDKLLIGYNTGTHAILCMSYDDLRKKLVDGATWIPAIMCPDGKFVEWFDSTGSITCKTLQ